ncbi:Ribonuclease P protein subunit p20 [Hypsizygus marmoreus]|uniref:Ribonuclease P protein subunit p20 n=1 Tax=Hypsizygus marmoreus TaxID=39966 RepID=A0A369JP72_HYPMA|nr:Ribonuclease P protein subunit p20 [Hypsizygus marmoreus]
MSSSASKKRKLDSATRDSNKRLKLTAASGSSRVVKVTTSTTEDPAAGDNTLTEVHDKNLDGVMEPLTTTESKVPKRRRINKLVPPRPFPTVPTSVSATGPRSAHNEGKNLICITRKTSLGAYMRRCKDVIIKDGYKTLYLSAMGAAIPLLLSLTMALPPILPFSADEIHTEVTTGTVEVQDEVIPDDEDEDITYQTRGKSTLKVVIKIGDGEYEGGLSGSAKKNGKNRGGNNGARPDKGVLGQRGSESGDKGKAVQRGSHDVILQEPEQEDMEML